MKVSSRAIVIGLVIAVGAAIFIIHAVISAPATRIKEMAEKGELGGGLQQRRAKDAAQKVNAVLLDAGIDAEAISLRTTTLIVCGSGVTRPLAHRLMSKSDIMEQLRNDNISEVEFYTSCSLSDSSTYDAEHSIGTYEVKSDDYFPVPSR